MKKRFAIDPKASIVDVEGKYATPLTAVVRGVLEGEDTLSSFRVAPEIIKRKMGFVFSSSDELRAYLSTEVFKIECSHWEYDDKSGVSPDFKISNFDKVFITED